MIDILLTVILFLVLAYMISSQVIHKCFLVTGLILGFGGIGYFSGNPFFGHILVFWGLLCTITLFGSYLTFVEKTIYIKKYFADKKHVWKTVLFGAFFLSFVIAVVAKNRNHLEVIQGDVISHRDIFNIMKSRASMIPFALTTVSIFMSFICAHLILKKEK